MRFRGLDLNLLAAFSALIEERSVSRAAKRLNLSQPAVSAALARLREHFGDELLVLEGKRMFPTAFAEALTPRVDEVLRSVGAILDSSGGFEPGTSTRAFRIVASDYVVMVLIRPLIRLLDQVAPGVRISVEVPGERTPARLEEGRVDLVVTPEEFASPRHPVELAFEERHVLVGWRGNPAMAGPVDEETFARLDHVGVMLGVDTPAAFADRQLDQLGRSRRVVVTVPHFSALPWLILETQRVGLMHERLALMMAERLPLAISPLPFPFPPMREVFQHHRARSRDPGLRWLLESLRACATDARQRESQD